MDFTKQVSDGALLLDATVPGWWAKVDVERLNLSKSCHCVLGQLGGRQFEIGAMLVGLPVSGMFYPQPIGT